jgi:hypothetical protein
MAMCVGGEDHGGSDGESEVHRSLSLVER